MKCDLRSFVMLLLPVLMGGCGSSVPSGDIVKTVQAEGVLHFQGNPLAFHQVTVMPSDGGRPAVGVSDETGHFILGTNRLGDGAIAGEHPYAVHYVGPPSTDPNEGMTVFTTPPPPKVKIPKKYTDPARSGLIVDIPAAGTTDLVLDLK